MCDEDDVDSIFCLFLEQLEDGVSIVGIQGTGGLVENQNRVILEQCAKKRKALLLSAAQVVPALGNVKPEWFRPQCCIELECCNPLCHEGRIQGAVWVAKSQVFFKGPREEIRTLADVGNATQPIFLMEVLMQFTVAVIQLQQDVSIVGSKHPDEGVEQCGFSCSGFADDRIQLTWLKGVIQILKDPRLV